MKAIKTILFILAFIAVIFGIIKKTYLTEKKNPSKKQLQNVMINSHTIILGNKIPNHFLGFLSSEKKKLTGIAFVTSHFDPIIKGYGGEIDILVGLNKEGKITGIKILNHNETPSYINSILKSGFLENFIGLTFENDFSAIDTITSATVSSKAIKDEIFYSLLIITEKILGLTIPKKTVSAKYKFYFKPDILVFIFILIIALFSFNLKKNQLLKNTTAILSIFGIGAYYNSFLYLGNITGLLSFEFPGISNPTLFILIIFVLITTPLYGNIFCNRLCPFGNIQEYIYKVFPMRWYVSLNYLKVLSSTRYYFLYCCIIAVCGFNLNSFTELEPFPYLFSWFIGTNFSIIWIYIGGILIISAFFYRFYCRIFCPTGLCLSFLSIKKKENNSNSIEEGLFETR